jgi:O-glycosyl hydrolase
MHHHVRVLGDRVMQQCNRFSHWYRFLMAHRLVSVAALTLIVVSSFAGNLFVSRVFPVHASNQTSGSFSSYMSAVLADQPVAYYHLDETSGTTAADASGNNYNATYQGSSYSLNQQGIFGSGSDAAVQLAGDNGYVSTANQSTPLAATTSNHDRTVELWFNTSQTNTQNLFATGSPGHTSIFDISLVGTDVQPGGCGSPGGIGLYVRFWDNDLYLTGLSLADAQWHYVVVTVSNSGNTVNVFIDGKQPTGYVWNGSCYTPSAQTQPFSMPYPVNTAATPIGLGNSDWGGGFSGAMDEVAIYPTALTAVRVAAHYAASGKNAIIIDPTIQYQTFKGWGTSLAWWAEVVGGWGSGNPDHGASLRAPLENALFTLAGNQVNGNNIPGLGLNVVRYNFGGVSPNTQCPNTWRPGGKVPSTILSLGGQWTPSADQAQIDVLQEVQNLETQNNTAPSIFEGFANSAPDWLLSNNCSQGSTPNNGKIGNNLTSPQEYANYLATIVQNFQKPVADGGLGITFQTVEPFNEPDVRWAVGGNQEGMHVDVGQQLRVISDLEGALQKNGANNYTSISAADWNIIHDAVRDYSCSNPFDCYTSLNDAIAQINVHSYNSYPGDPNQSESARHALDHTAWLNSKPLWMSEYTTDGSSFLGPVSHPCKAVSGASPNDIGVGLVLSCQILNDMRNMQPQVWCYWQAIEDHGAYGLLQTPLAPNPSTQQLTYTKQYYTMAQYSRFIRPGYQLIAIDDTGALAAYNPSLQKVEIVVTNTDPKQRPYTFDLSKFTLSSSATVARWQTDGTENLYSLSPIALNGGTQFTDTVPSQSITTYDITGVTGVNTAPQNLLSNGDFENGNLGNWQEEWAPPGPQYAGIEYTYPYGGQYDAYLHPTSSQDVAIYQTVTAPQNGNFTLTAYASTNIKQGVQLGVDVNGVQVASTFITANTGYRYYTLPIPSVNAGQVIKVWYYADKTSGWATLDDVVLSITS